MREADLDKVWECRIVGHGKWRVYESEDGQAVAILKVIDGEEINRDQRGIAGDDCRGKGRTG